MKRRQRTHVMLDGERTTICGRTRVDAVLAMNGEDVTCTVCVQGLSYERVKKERDEARAEVAALQVERNRLAFEAGAKGAEVAVLTERTKEAQADVVELEAIHARLAAEVAALREEVEQHRRLKFTLDTMLVERAEKAERELAEARALLARVLDWEHGNHKNPDADYWPPDVDAFLRRREAHGEPCRCVFRRQGGVDPKCELHGDEARRCTCPGYVHEKGDHQPGCELARRLHTWIPSSDPQRCSACGERRSAVGPYCTARDEGER